MIALITALILASVPHLFAQDGEAPALNVVPEEVIHQAVEAYVLDRVAGQVQDEDRVTVHTRWQGAVLLDRPGPVEFRIMPLSSRPFRGPVVVRIEILVHGETAKVLTATVDTRIHRPVLVTTRTLRRDTAITEEMVELVERDVTSLKSGSYTDLSELDGLQTRRPVGFGDVLTKRHMEPIPVINRGDDVLLVTESANMQLSVRGEALQEGGIGARIRVRNTDSGKVLSGQIVDAATIRVGS